MNAPEERWWLVRAGEYVLGTLSDDDRQLFEKILASDTEMQASVAQWERRLAPLGETADERQPGEHVLPELLARIRQAGDRETPTSDTPVAAQAQAGEQTATVHELRKSGRPARSAAFWPGLAGLATAASLLLSVMLLQPNAVPTLQPLNVDGVAVVLSDDSGEPVFLVETDYGNSRVRVTALAPPSVNATQDLQLWQALPDRSAVRPVALLPEQVGAARTYDVSSLVVGSDLFGVSVEPVGAATDAGPTGPVVAHGDFLPTRVID